MKKTGEMICVAFVVMAIATVTEARAQGCYTFDTEPLGPIAGGIRTIPGSTSYEFNITHPGGVNIVSAGGGRSRVGVRRSWTDWRTLL